jgi:hypothetical protein
MDIRLIEFPFQHHDLLSGFCEMCAIVFDLILFILKLFLKVFLPLSQFHFKFGVLLLTDRRLVINIREFLLHNISIIAEEAFISLFLQGLLLKPFFELQREFF